MLCPLMPKVRSSWQYIHCCSEHIKEPLGYQIIRNNSPHCS
jgi:hypothetical protein